MRACRLAREVSENWTRACLPFGTRGEGKLDPCVPAVRHEREKKGRRRNVRSVGVSGEVRAIGLPCAWVPRVGKATKTCDVSVPNARLVL
ncbi:unnamed protein product [Prunus armeniaca]